MEVKYMELSFDALMRFYVENALVPDVTVHEYFYDPAAKVVIMVYSKPDPSQNENTREEELDD